MSELTKSRTDGSVACVASVSSGRETNSFSWPRENRASAKKKKNWWGGGGGGEERGRKRLRTNPLIMKTPVSPRTGSLIARLGIFD